MTLVGLHVHSPEKEGLDAGELCGLAPTGVLATWDIRDILKAKPDCVLYMQQGMDIDAICYVARSRSERGGDLRRVPPPGEHGPGRAVALSRTHAGEATRRFTVPGSVPGSSPRPCRSS